MNSHFKRIKLGALFFIASFVFFITAHTVQAAISFVGSASNSASPNSDTVVNVSGIGIQANDLIIVSAAVGDTTSNGLAAPTEGGYSRVPGVAATLYSNSTNDSNFDLYYKIASGSETTVTFGAIGGSNAANVAVVMVFRGVDESSPFDTNANTASNTGEPNPPSHNHSGAAGTAVVIAGATGFSGTTGTFTAPANYTTNFAQRSHDDTISATVGMGYRLSPADPEDPAAFTSSGHGTAANNGSSAVTMSLKPDPPETILGNGTDPGNSTIGPGASVTDIDKFTLTTNFGTDNITALTVTMAGGTGINNIAKVEIVHDGTVADECTDIDNPSSGTLNFTGCSLAADTDGETFRIRITPKTHANMEIGLGQSYGATARVSAITATNTVVGSDSAGTTITVDNLSPNVATSSSVSAGDGANTLAWTASNSSDISQSVVLRWADSNPGGEVPVEGTSYTAGNTITDSIGTSATVACVLTSTASQSHSAIVDGTSGTTGCVTSALTNGQAYSYRIFSKDTNGNYSGENLVAQSAGNKNWTGSAIDQSDHDVYAAVYNGDIWYRAGGTGSFSALSQTSRGWEDLAVDSTTHDVYATVSGTGSDIYKCTNASTACVPGTASFVALGTGLTNWAGITIDNSTGYIYAARNGGDVYVSTNNGSSWSALNLAESPASWYGLYVDSSTHDLYVSLHTGDIYKCTNATTSCSTPSTADVVALSQTSRSWVYGSIDSTSKTVYTSVFSGGVYKQINGTGNFLDLTQTTRSWQSADIDIGNKNLYATVYGGDIYMSSGGVPSGSPVTPSAPFTISGTTNITGNPQDVIKVVINGSLNSAAGDVSGSTWSVSPTSAPTTGQSVIVFINGQSNSDESTVVTKYDGSGNLDDLVLTKGQLTIGSANSQSIALSDIDDYTCSTDEDVMYSVISSVLNVEGQSCEGSVNNSYTDATLSIPASNTLTVANGETVTTENLSNAGTITATGSPTFNINGTSGTLFANSGTFTQATSTVSMAGTSGNPTINSGSPTFYNLQVSGGTTKTLGAAITLASSGTLTLSSSAVFDPSTYTVTGSGSNTIAVSSATLRVGGSTFADSYSSGFGTITLNSGSTVEYSRSGAQTIRNDLSYVNLATSGSNTKTLGGNTTVTTNVNIGSDSTLGLSSYTLTLSGTGSSIITGSGSLSGGTGTVKFTGDGSVTVPDYTYNNLELTPTITSGRTYTLDVDTVSGNFTLNPTAASALTLTANMNAHLTVTGTTTLQRTSSASVALDTDTGTDRNLTTGYLSIQTGGTLDAGGSASTINLSGTSGTLFTVNGGTFTAGSSTVDLTGNGDAMINSGTPTFYNLTLSGTGTKSAATALTMGGNLTISNSGGIFEATGYDITVSGNVTNSGTFDAGGAGVGGGSMNGWSHYRPIVIDYTKVPNSTQTNFPMLVSGTYAYLATTGNGGEVEHASGYDIAFFSDAGLTTMLDFEVEKWSATTGELIAWVKIPSLSHTANTTIYMAYGNSSISTDQSDPTNVWDSNYGAVWHVPNGSTLSLLDSTSNDKDGTNSGSATATTGKIDGGISYNGSSQYATVSSSAAIEPTTALTLEAWINTNDNTLTQNVFAKGTNDQANGTYAMVVYNQKVQMQIYQGGFVTVPSTTTISNSTWYHVVGTWNGSTMRLYVNGSEEGTPGTLNSPITANGATLQLGRLGLGGFPYWFNGKNDEMRISSVARSADWIAAQYNNQSDPSSFYTVGSDSVGASYLDEDVQAFLTATGITERSIANAIDGLVANAKAHTWWDKALAIYPFVGGTEATHKYNLKDPRDLDAAYRLEFNGTWSHSPNGADPNGTDAYADTNFIPNGVQSLGSTHLSHYSRENTYRAGITCSVDIGGRRNTTAVAWLTDMCDYGAGVAYIGADTGGAVGTTSSADGYFMSSRVSNTDLRFYKNGSQLGSTFTTSQTPYATFDSSLFIGANSDAGVANLFSNRQTAFASIGAGISSTMAADMYDDIEAFQTALGRNMVVDTEFEFEGEGRGEEDSTATIAVGGNWTNTGTVEADQTTIKLTNTSSSDKLFSGGNQTYHNLWLAGGAGGGDYAINDDNIFTDIKDDGSVAHAIQFKAGDTQTIGSLTLTGAGSGSMITLTSGDGSGNGVNTTHTLMNSSDREIEVDYVVVSHSIAIPHSQWLAGQNSTNNQSSATAGSGWIFNTKRNSRGGGGGNAGGESSGGGTPVGGGTGHGGGGGGAGGEGSGGGNPVGGGTGQGGGGGDTGLILIKYPIAALKDRDFLALLRKLYIF